MAVHLAHVPTTAGFDMLLLFLCAYVLSGLSSRPASASLRVNVVSSRPTSAAAQLGATSPSSRAAGAGGADSLPAARQAHAAAAEQLAKWNEECLQLDKQAEMVDAEQQQLLVRCGCVAGFVYVCVC